VPRAARAPSAAHARPPPDPGYASGDYDAYCVGWVADFPDPETFTARSSARTPRTTTPITSRGSRN